MGLFSSILGLFKGLCGGSDAASCSATSSNSGMTSVERYIQSQSSDVQLTSVERYIRNNS